MTVKAFSAGFLSAALIFAVFFYGQDDSRRAYVPPMAPYTPQAFSPAASQVPQAFLPPTAQAAPHHAFPAQRSRARPTYMSGVESELRELVVENLAVDAAKVTAGASFTDDLDADSLDVVELVMAIEEKFDIEIPEEQAAAVSTFGELVKEVETLKNA